MVSGSINSMAVRLLEQTRISPSPQAAGDPPRDSLPLTPFDALWMNQSPVERLFFYSYPHSTDHFLCSHLPRLKSSLSHSLSVFYPLAGTIRRRQSDGRFEIFCSPTDSVSLMVFEHLQGDSFLDLSGDHPRPVSSFLPLLPHLPKSIEAQPLLTLQFTIFPSHGLSLALVLHHAACDGFSSIHFVKHWAATFRSDDDKVPSPAFDRSVIPDPRGLYKQISDAILQCPEKQIIKSAFDEEGVIATYHFTPAALESLKRTAHSQAEKKQGRKVSFHCSSFVVSSAYTWICLLKTRLATDGEGMAHFLFAVDWRQRMRPKIPAYYYGNCLTAGSVGMKAEDLLNCEEKEGFFVACEAIGRVIGAMSSDVWEELDGIEARLEAVAPSRPLTVAGSVKLGVYGIDFGWGKPRKVEVISTRATGAVSVAERRDGGGGGIELGIVLTLDDMKTFAHHFASGMLRLIDD
ncbi:hypothetical protein HPP92_025979 [Vanilla planifolia]|uniref:Uncharacterized protein n=1 Tax=Vanilla planifolia TaxID=51239 RepID=A0A835PJ06_VANPL|nr:hypothetical protein HPP92_025979 [Vanilla planifolia]